ncbi:MAG: Tryptophan--tRNA ligase [Desulfovibrio sp.]
MINGSLTNSACGAEHRVVSGMRPTGPLHLGHYFGALKNWVEMQETMQAFYFVADWHALTSEYENTQRVQEYVPELVKDWIASGLDPEKCVIFRQSSIKEHAELHLLLSMMTPVSWLERCPTYKEQQQNITDKDLSNYGFLGYPVLMATDIIMYRPKWVPVGADQVPHLEMTREIARRFNNLYGEYFPEPEAKLTPAAKCPGLDGRKMSKSYNNFIALRETIEEITPKVRGMLTDQKRLRKTDPGNPADCNLFPYHELLTDAETRKEICAGCTSATLGCVDCKKILLQGLETFLEPLHERRAKLEANPKAVWEILHAGNEKARAFASETMIAVRELMHMQDGI